MDGAKREAAPIVLSVLTGAALLMSLTAWHLRATDEELRPYRIKTAARPIVAPKAQSRVCATEIAKPYRPALAALQCRPADYVRRVAAPLTGPVAEPCAQPLLALTPAAPEWSAAQSPCWRLFGRQPFELAEQWGRTLGESSNRSRQIVDWRPLVRRLAELSRPKSIASPPTATSQVRVGPGERIAMSPTGRDPSLRQIEPCDTTPIPAEPPKQRPPLPSGESCRSDALALRAQIAKLLGNAEADAWARGALTLVDRILGEPPMVIDGFDQMAQRLKTHASEGHRLADQVQENRTAVLLRKAAYAIERRSETWRIANRIGERNALARLGNERLGNALLTRKLSLLASGSDGLSWREHLRNLQLQAHAEPDLSNGQALLARIAAEDRGHSHSGRLAYSPLASLEGTLELAPPDPVDVAALVEDLELYELKPRADIAERIAVRQQELLESRQEDYLRLAQRINQDYRNANLRIAIKDELLKRGLPQTMPSSQPVRDTIAGARVRGSATTDTNLSLRLTPDPAAWRIALLADGQVSSQTVAFGGPARLHSRGVASFFAQKQIVVNPSGVHARSAECDADSHNKLVRVKTDYDSVPLLSNLVHSRAEEEYRDSQSRARQQTEARVSQQVSDALDSQSREFLQRMRKNYEQHVRARADTLGLRVEPIELRTTSDRLIARVRMASNRQLAAHTPRNRAPVDSLLSMQLHESLLNNALAGLELGGKTLTPETLREQIATKLAVSTTQEPSEDADRAVFLFDATQPARVALAQGRVEVILSFAEMAVDRTLFQDFKVHAFFVPTATLEGLWLTLDSPVQIEGRLRSAKRARLHGVFAKVLPEGKRFTLATISEQQRARLAGLMVTQVVVDDGWFGLALGPRRQGRIALRERFVR